MDGADLYAQEARLVPFLLSGLFDEDEALREEAIELVEAAGRDYLSQHEADFKLQLEYDSRNDDAEAAASIVPELPHPFQAQPSVGACARIRNHFRAIVHPVVKELASWTARERLQSASLLEMSLIFVGAHATEFGHLLLPALAQAIDPECPALAGIVARCTARFAGYVDASCYIPLLLSKLKQDPLNSLAQRARYCLLVPSLLQGARAPHQIARQVLDQVLEDGAACSQHTMLRAAIRELLQALCRLGQSPSSDVVDTPAGASEAAKEGQCGGGLCGKGMVVGGGEGCGESSSNSRGRHLVLALLLWHGSTPVLQKQIAVQLSESVEELKSMIGGSEWRQAVGALEDDLELIAVGWRLGLCKLLTRWVGALTIALQCYDGATQATRMLQALLGDSYHKSS